MHKLIFVAFFLMSVTSFTSVYSIGDLGCILDKKEELLNCILDDGGDCDSSDSCDDSQQVVVACPPVNQYPCPPSNQYPCPPINQQPCLPVQPVTQPAGQEVCSAPSGNILPVTLQGQQPC